jgi:mitochondrial translocator assembly and maintenance protein 41
VILGDFRRYVGENPNKVKNVVSKQMESFNLLYGGLIRGLPSVDFVTNGKLQVRFLLSLLIINESVCR